MVHVGRVNVNVNIFTPLYGDGLPNMERMKVLKRKIRGVLSVIPHPLGVYFDSHRIVERTIVRCQRRF